MTGLELIIVSYFIFTKIFVLPNVCLNIMLHVILTNLILKVAPLYFIENHKRPKSSSSTKKRYKRKT